ncbi:unnamed protein product [Cunninghamella blakesleeana]
MLQRLEFSMSPIHSSINNNNNNSNNNNNNHHHQTKINPSYIQNVLTMNSEWQHENMTTTINIPHFEQHGEQKENEESAYETEYSSFSSSATLLTPINQMNEQKFYLPSSITNDNNDDDDTVFDEESMDYDYLEEEEHDDDIVNNLIKKEIPPIVKQQRSLLSSMLLHSSSSSSSASISSFSSSSSSSTFSSTPFAPTFNATQSIHDNELSTSLKQYVYWEQLQNNQQQFMTKESSSDSNRMPSSYSSNSLNNFIGW